MNVPSPRSIRGDIGQQHSVRRDQQRQILYMQKRLPIVLDNHTDGVHKMPILDVEDIMLGFSKLSLEQKQRLLREFLTRQADDFDDELSIRFLKNHQNLQTLIGVLTTTNCDPIVRLYCIQCLGNLMSGRPENTSKVLSSCGAYLIAFIGHSDAQLREVSLLSLTNAAYDSRQARIQLTQLGLFSNKVVLSECLLHYDDRVCNATLHLLIAFLSQDDGHNVINDYVENFVTILKGTKITETHMLACWVIYLTAVPRLVPEIYAEQITSLCSKYFEHDDNVSISCGVCLCRALGFIVPALHNSQKIVPELCEIMKKLLSATCLQQFLKEFFWSLFNFTTRHDICVAISRQDIILSAIVQHCAQTLDEETRNFGLGILANVLYVCSDVSSHVVAQICDLMVLYCRTSITQEQAACIRRTTSLIDKNYTFLDAEHRALLEQLSNSVKGDK